MTTVATTARLCSLGCEAKIIRKSANKDGHMITVLLHPHEGEESAAHLLWNRPIGAPVQMGVVATTPEGIPIPPEAAMQYSSPQPKSSRAKRSWDEMTPAQQAGVLCADKSFQKFMGVEFEQSAIDHVRIYCNVKSRADIVQGDKSNDYWLALVAKYRAWMREPSVVPA